MCFSEQTSLTLSIIGILLSAYRIYYKYPMVAIVPAVFYTCMEITQYCQYKVIDKCDSKINQNLTKFTWLLEWIQPLMWNILYYNITTSNKGVFVFTITLSLIVFITGLLRVFNTSTKKSVTHELQVKGRNCALTGKKHLIWNNNAQTYYGLEPNWFICLLAWFLPMLWIRPIKHSITTLVGTLLGFILTYFIIGQKWNDEFASTWCLISLPGVLLGEVYYIK